MPERHLVIQELILKPSGEWTPRGDGWTIARIAQGCGYWMQSGNIRQLNQGDGFVAYNGNVPIRASQLGTLKLQFFTVQPQLLNGLLTVSEWHQTTSDSAAHTSIFTSSEPLGQKFTHIINQTRRDELYLRCALIQLWTNVVSHLLSAPEIFEGTNKLNDRFRKLMGQMLESELSQSSLTDLAGRLHCSERHFSRLFRKEFGVPLRARQIELRLQRARQLLTSSDAKIINVAYDSGYRHLGLFNAMFKKRFGMTPSEWRQQNLRKTSSTPRTRTSVSRVNTGIGILMIMLGFFFRLPLFAQTDSEPMPFILDTPALRSSPENSEASAMAAARFALLKKIAELDAQDAAPKFHIVPISTNGPHFAVSKYLVMGNSALKPGDIGGVFRNVPAAFGTNVTMDAIRAVLGDLQMAYRERGFATVSVGLPQQKLTNAEVKVKVTEGRLVAIDVVGNHYFSSNNVVSVLPDLKTGILLNAKIFQRELDVANASRDRQIYPVIGPGSDPGTTELTLNVKDRLPLHMRSEVNNLSTPGTPNLRENFDAQYDNLWDLEHQVGLQYTFAFEQFKNENNFIATPLDEPLVANYSAYYRFPIGNYTSVQQQINDNPTQFGYNEVTHQFVLPAPTGRPELTFYASRSVSDTGVQFGGLSNVISTPLTTIDSQNTGDNVSLNEDFGGRLTVPLPQLANVSSTLSLGMDFKRFRQIGYNTNNFYVTETVTNSLGQPVTIKDTVSSGQLPLITMADYLPLNLGWSGSIPDKWGTTFLNAQLNFGVPLSSSELTSQTVTSTNAPSYTTNKFFRYDPHTSYVTLQLGANRELKLSDDFSIKLHGDGQWANKPLNSNEQFAMGGTVGVRGYNDGEAYGDSGWRLSIEPQTRLFNVGMIGNEGHLEPCWVRTSVFLDYGQIYLLDSPTTKSRQNFCGVGWSVSANLGSHFDTRVTIACPLTTDTLSPSGTQTGDVHIYFGAGAQF